MCCSDGQSSGCQTHFLFNCQCSHSDSDYYFCLKYRHQLYLYNIADGDICQGVI